MTKVEITLGKSKELMQQVGATVCNLDIFE
jgi:hypothetical protein